MSKPREVELTQEVRFAVVMYGGVSLAIYIYGVARELLSLVRATAPEPKDANRLRVPNDKLQGAEKVYRRLAQLLDQGRLKRDGSPCVRTRFVVDILSGTSAGGINAVFLAKALANEQGLENLASLWLNEGDLGVLLNDSHSRLPGADVDNPPASLLNGNRLYLKLLEAFREMERAKPSGESKESAFVDELDLYVTATDLEGLKVPIRLADGSIDERKHRSVFRFRYFTPYAAGGEETTNELQAKQDPLLAFAARTTSAFPVAFEPFTLEDAKRLAGDGPFDEAALSLLFGEYLKNGARKGLCQRPFADGGYLDNKPFSYATETIRRHRADLPVDRKLVYIEPAPETREKVWREKPDALENLQLAALALPRYETIREDLSLIRERNATIVGLRRILTEAAARARDEAAQKFWKTSDIAANRSGRQWASKDLDEMVKEYGVSYALYHQLRVSAVVDDLTRLVTRVAAHDEKSDEQEAIRHLVEAWKEKAYGTQTKRGPGDQTENAFLYSFDLSWRLRRLSFIQQTISDLLLEEKAGRLLQTAAPGESIGDRDQFRRALLAIRRGINHLFVDLRGLARLTRSRHERDRVAPYLKGYADAVRSLMDNDHLKRALKEVMETCPQGRKQNAQMLLNDPEVERGLDRFAGALRAVFEQRVGQVSLLARRLLGLNGTERLGEPLDPLARGVEEALSDLENQGPDGSLARRACQFYYDGYEYFDMVSLPLTFQTEAGESDIVEVFRISPWDAKSLEPDGGKKLAGTALGNFGAFFVRDWRENDMLWGRLDAAERIISMLLPDEKLSGEEREIRTQLIQEAHEAILQEARLGERAKVARLIAEEIDSIATSTRKDPAKQASTSDHQQAARAKASEFLDPSRLGLIWSGALRAYASDDALREHFVQSLPASRPFPERETLENVARSSKILGRLLEGLTEKYLKQGRKVAWFTRLASIFWGFVMISVPDSLPRLVWRHFLHLLYFSFALMVVVGTAFMPDLAKLGLCALVVTFGAQLFSSYLEAVMRRAPKWGFRALAGAVFVLAIVCGALGLATLIKEGRAKAPQLLQVLPGAPRPDGAADLGRRQLPGAAQKNEEGDDARARAEMQDRLGVE